VRAVHAYDLLPYEVSKVVGAALPFVEITVGVFLVAGFATRIAAIASSTLLVVFVGGIASAWARGLRIDCGCFGGGGQLGAGQEPTYLLDILRDFGLVLLGAWIVRFPPGRFALDRPLGLAGVDHLLDEEENGDEQGRPGEVGA
jgi:uncharacterized membrane protein YphA (DoxX/SURF4 family)